MTSHRTVDGNDSGDCPIRVGIGSMLVKTEEDAFGVQCLSPRRDGVIKASRRPEDALARIRDAANTALEVLRKTISRLHRRRIWYQAYW